MSFMTNIFSKAGASALALGAVLSFGAGEAEAVTVSFTGGFTSDNSANGGTLLSGTGKVAQNALSGDEYNVDFRWETTPYLAYAEFTTNAAFELTFQDYSPEKDYANQEGARSGFQLYYGSIGGTLTPIFPQTPATEPSCGSDVLAAFGSTDCVLVTGAGNDPTAFITPVVSARMDDYGYGAGTYVLMFSEGNNPNNGSAEFIISAVPLPAGGLLLMTALGGMAVVRRKRKAA